MDVRYLKECLGKCLVEGLAQVVERQPSDPVNFLACWIYKYKNNLKEEEKRKIERAQLEQEREEALAQLERIEKLKAEELHLAQKYEEYQKVFPEQHSEKTIVDLKCEAPNLPTVEEIDESHLNEKRTEETGTSEVKQETLGNILDQGELHTAKNEVDEILQGVNVAKSLQEALTETITEEELHLISEDEAENQSEHSEESENEHDIQTGVNTPDEEYKSSHNLSG